MSFVSKHQKRVEEEEKALEDLISQGNPEEEKEEEEEVQDKDENLSDEEKTFKKRYGDLRRHSQKQTQELKDRIDTLEKTLQEKVSTEAPAEVPSNMQEMLEWKEKYPSVARIIETMIEQEAEKKLKDAKLSIDEIKTERQQSKKDKALRQITEAHSDFEDLQDSEEFQDWAENQPKWIQTALFEQDDDANSVIKVIDLYKMEVEKSKKPVKDKEEKKKAAGLVDTKGQRTSVDDKDAGGKIKESAVSRMSVKEYATNEDKIMEAIRTGNFVYDISGGAR